MMMTKSNTTDAYLLRERLEWPESGPLSRAELRALLARGADPDDEDDEGATALSHAFSYASDRVVRAVARVSRKPYNVVVLCRAVARGRVPLLLEVGGRLGPCDVPLLHVAVRGLPRRMVSTVRLLLARGANPNVRYCHWRTPLHLLARVVATPEQEEAMRVLLAAGADPRARDADGATPLDLACPRGARVLAAALAQ